MMLKKYHSDLYKLNCALPLSLADILQRKSDDMMIPSARLMLYALDNELDAPTPFRYSTALDSSSPGLYVEHAAKIVRWMEQYTTGIGRDMLVLSRRDIGVPDKIIFLHALEELLSTGILEEYRRKSGYGWRYPADYRKLRVTPTDTKRNKRYKDYK